MEVLEVLASNLAQSFGALGGIVVGMGSVLFVIDLLLAAWRERT